MITLTGRSVFDGIAIGRLSFYKREERAIQKCHIADTDAQIRRFEAAKTEAQEALKELHEKAAETVGEAGAKIFKMHRMILADPDYTEAIVRIIKTREVNAEFAIQTAAENFSAMFEAMEDGYMQGRAADVKDVSDRLLRVISEGAEASMQIDEPVILAADDLAPSETIGLDQEKVLSFVTRYGSANSHTSILARTMNIPAVIGLGKELLAEYDGKMAIVDGFGGTVYIEPDEAVMEAMQKKRREDQEQKALLLQLKGKENVTVSGQKVDVYANIGSLSDVEAALQNDAGGIGLFRSEFLYLGSDTFPTEEQQFAVYKTVAEKMAGKRVIVRTLDMGADKQVDYFGLEKEENPALGCRGIRVCLRQPEIFKTQLRALYRASAFGQIAILFPMIISVEEVRRILAVIEEVKEELRREGTAFREEVELGVMIETPAAVMVSGDLAKEVDFFSVGTNDLTQYTLAIDRRNPKLEDFYDPHHPAVLSMIKMAADHAHAEGKWIGICGELASDFSLTETFLKMGIDELSVVPGMILKLRKKIRKCSIGGLP